MDKGRITEQIYQANQNWNNLMIEKERKRDAWNIERNSERNLCKAAYKKNWEELSSVERQYELEHSQYGILGLSGVPTFRKY